MEIIALVLAVVSSSVGAAWMLRTKLSDIEAAIRDHVSSDTAKFEALGARVIKLEKRRGSR